MSYQVLARRWRPQRFDDVVGQRGVTRTLKNALARGRIGQAFVFAGPRGVGKTTTARILAKALNCAGGPTPDPCGTCDACREIAEGRDIDVLEIDGATHTQIDTVREVIIAGLAMAPVRDRYKIFIIDEVHQLSAHSFNALLKSIEEPPPHVVFIMATTELGKIPETITSRAQVYEFRTIVLAEIVAQLSAIAKADGIAASEAALVLIARAAEGSMRDAQSAFDQVIAFAGEQVEADDVAAVLGLVGRDLLFGIVEAVADEDAAGVLGLAAQAVERGHDLRQVFSELSRLVRDILVVSVDAGRLDDPEIVAASDRERLRALADRFSREDCLRAFDLLTRAEMEIRQTAEPRYYLELALLKWIYLGKLVPLDEIIAGLGKDAGGASSPAGRPPGRDRVAVGGRSSPEPGTPSPAMRRAVGPEPRPAPVASVAAEVASPSAAPAPPVAPRAEDGPADEAGALKDAFLAELRRSKKFLYGTVVAQAQAIRWERDRVVFTFAPAHRALSLQLEQNAPWLETLAQQVAGHRMKIQTAVAPGTAPASAPVGATEEPGPPSHEQNLRARAMADSGVQALLDVFAAEIEDVEEME